jgi:hypothetical protein
MNIQNILNHHFEKIALVFILVIFLQECSNSSKLNNLEKKVKIANARLDSLCTRDELVKSLEIEGLKAEKRMIQSTDRRMMDVNRQAEIDGLIKKIEK